MTPCKPRRRHLATIQRPPSADDQDSTGQPIESWSTLGTWWVSIEPLNGRELFAAQQVNAETTTRISGRYRADVTADMRIQYAGVNYNIQSIIDPELRHAELIVLASSGLNDG